MSAYLLPGTQAALARPCPQCGAAPEKNCRTPGGSLQSRRQVHQARRQPPAPETVRKLWLSRLDGFCAELEQAGFEVHRDGLNVRIIAPAGRVIHE